jgi:putative ABC transport system permease protein
MWKVTVKYLAARKLRLLLTGIAVTLGVAFIAGTLVLTDTVQRTFDDLFGSVYEHTDAVVRGTQPFKSDITDTRHPVPASLLATVKAVPGVQAAEPDVSINYAQLVDTKGKAVGNPGNGPPALGFNWKDNKDLNPFRLTAGSQPPRADNQIVIDKGSADKGHLKVGDQVRVLTQKSSSTYTIVGIAKFGTVDNLAGASAVMFTTSEAQQIANLGGKYTAVSVVADKGISQDQIASRIRQAISSDKNVEVITGAKLTKETQDNIKRFLGFFRTALLVFAGVALIVGAFIIYNTFSIIVAQRMREMALLRAVGASSRQVTNSVLVESLTVGVIASLIGLGLGILLSSALKALLNAFGLQIPGGGIVIRPTTFVLSLAVGVIVTVVSAVLPARRAARVPPVAAMRDVAIESTSRSARRGVIGTVILGLGIAGLFVGLFASVSNGLALVGLGMLLVFVGVFVLSPLIARPVGRIVGAPLPRLKGMTGTLARENAMRNPKRTANTAAALMIGVALIGFITIFAASANASISSAVDNQLKTDYIITSGNGGFGGGGFSPTLAQNIGKLPEVAAVTPVRFGVMKVAGASSAQLVQAADPVASEQMFDFGFTSGTFTDLTPDGVAISKKYADKHHLKVGDTLAVQFVRTGKTDLTVQGIYKNTQLAGTFLTSLANFERNQPEQAQIDAQIFAKLKPGVSPAQGRAAIEPLLKKFPTAKLQDQAQYKKDQEKQINQLLSLIYALLGLAVIIALIGIVNTLALSVYERTREIGLLRAVGMTRRQVRSAIRWESVIIAVLGSVLGLVIGLFFGWVFVEALRDQGFTNFAAAPGQLLVVVIIAGLLGVVAAIYPARRAAKLDVLRAISTE